jgi:molecular chaperone GrpE
MPSSPVSEDVQAATLEELEARNQQLEDRYLRALADLENYRKRAGRELERRMEEGTDAVVRNWLELVDSVDRAALTDAERFRPLEQQIGAILDREGIARVGCEGQPFDPERHEAIGVRETGEVPDRTIVAVARSGFARGPRVLRPAQVIVARNP